eukprot:XP_014789656.1 PREDICTED: uncharacterized protein LOC106883238 [Octopus bimaculoides]
MYRNHSQHCQAHDTTVTPLSPAGADEISAALSANSQPSDYTGVKNDDISNCVGYTTPANINLNRSYFLTHSYIGSIAKRKAGDIFCDNKSKFTDAYALPTNKKIINKKMRRREKLITDVLVFVISIFAGMQMTTSICYTCFDMKCLDVTSNTQNQNIAKVPIEPFLEELGDFQFNPGPKKKLVLVGVMTSSQYFETRDWAIRMTWLKSIPGDVVFFVGNTTDPAPPGMPLVRLNRVPDNVYPPQGKVFEMLKYLHENHADKYEYFIRADDDAFIKGQELGSLLKSLNSEEKIYMGHYGQGTMKLNG